MRLLTLLALAATCLLPLAHAEPSDAEYKEALNFLTKQGEEEGKSATTYVKNMIHNKIEKETYKNIKESKNFEPKQEELARAFARIYADIFIEKTSASIDKMAPKPSFMEKAYKKILTREETIELAKFYQSPAGKSVMEKTPLLMEEMGKEMDSISIQIAKAISSIDEDEKEIKAEINRRLEAEGFTPRKKP